MFFLLRCVFWLGLVFSALPWNGEGSRFQPALALEAARGAVATASAVTGEYCAATPAECLKAAAQLNALFEQISAQAEIPPGELSPQNLSPQDRTSRWRARSGGNSAENR